MRTQIFAIAALMGVATLGVQAQTPTPQEPPARPTEAQERPQTPAAAGQAVTITGCLKEEKDVPGRRPNIAERAGIAEDYLLTNVKMGQGSTAQGIGLAPLYEIEGIDDAELKKHLNHQVELTGTISGQPGATPEDAPEFQATSLKMISATCAAQ